MRPVARSGRTAFTLTEAVLALGLFSVVAVGLLAALGTGLQSARVAQADYRLHLLAENLQARLLVEPDWPAFGTRNEILLGYDESGSEQPLAEARLHVRFRRIPHPHWPRQLEAFVTTIQSPQGDLLETYFLSRAVTAQRP